MTVATEKIQPSENGKAAKSSLPRRPATLEDLKQRKKARRTELPIPLNIEGEEIEVLVKLKAIGTTAYDDLVAEHPPTPKQRQQNPGSVFNGETFSCALISACAVEPAMSYSDVEQIKKSDDWAGGEFNDLFMACVRLNQAGFDVPFTAGG